MSSDRDPLLEEPTGRDEYRAARLQLVLHSRKQQQKVFPSSVSRSGSSEASVQIQTTALQPQSLNWPPTRPTATGQQHEALVFPQKGVRSLQLFVPFSSCADPANIQTFSGRSNGRDKKVRRHSSSISRNRYQILF